MSKNFKVHNSKKKALVITSVNKRNDAVKKFEKLCKKNKTDFIFVADKKTPEFKYNNDDYLKWTTHKKNVFKKSKDLKIKIENISLFEYPGDHQELILVQFKQKYSSSLLSNEMIKQQIWTKRDSQWSIIYEGGT